jgi:hypothetical protein
MSLHQLASECGQRRCGYLVLREFCVGPAHLLFRISQVRHRPLVRQQEEANRQERPFGNIPDDEGAVRHCHRKEIIQRRPQR